MHVVVVTSIPTGPALGDTTGWFDAHTAEIFHLPRFLPSELWDDFLSHLVASKEVDLLWIAGSAFAYDNLRALRAQYPGLRVVDLQFNLVGHTENNRRRRELIDLTIVESAVVRDGLLAQGETENRIRLVESGVDVERLTPALRSAEVRDEIVQASGDLIVAYCGRWSSEKAPLVFIEMARQADPAWPVRFVMTGTGPLGAEIRCAIKDADFPAGRFHLLGEIADVLPIIASADLLVIPSIVDGRPVVALEAFACGTPVVASRVGGLPALVSHGVTGWLCEPADVPDLLRSLAAAVADPGALARMRDAARRYAEEHLDIRHMFHAYEGVLVEVSRTTEHRPESIGVNSSSTAEGDLYLSGSSGTDGPR